MSAPKVNDQLEIDGEETTLAIEVVQLPDGQHVVALSFPEPCRTVGLSCIAAAKLANALAHRAQEALKLNQEAGSMPPNPPIIVRPH